MKKEINLVKDYHDCKKDSVLKCDCQFLDIHKNIYENIKKEVIKEYIEKLIKWIEKDRNSNSNKIIEKGLISKEYIEGWNDCLDILINDIENGEFE